MPTTYTKYSSHGNFISSVFANWNIDEELCNILSDRANKGLSKNTWKQYQTVFNHLKRCEISLGKSMQLPFDLEKTLNFIGYLIKERNCSSGTINSYLSAVRMALDHEGCVWRCSVTSNRYILSCMKHLTSFDL